MGKGSPCLFQELCLKFNGRAIVDLARIPLWHFAGSDVFFGQQIHFDEQIRADDERLSGKGRKALIWRVAKSGRSKREYLPEMLAGGREKVNEIISARSEIADPIRGWEGCRMQQDSGETNRSFFFYKLRFGLSKLCIHNCKSPSHFFFSAQIPL